MDTQKNNRINDEQIAQWWAENLNTNKPEDNEHHTHFTSTKKLLMEMKEIEKFDANTAWDKLYDRLDNDKLLPAQTGRMVGQRWHYLAIAASVLLLIATTFTWIFVTNKNAQIPHILLVVDHIQTINLSDGSIISLNKGAEIEYPREFTDSIRKVKLHGEAFFQVAKNSKCPFVIETDMGRIRVLGTSFNVDMQNNQLLVTVSSGKVQLAAINQLQNAVVVTPGETGVTNGINVKKSSTSNRNYLCWLNKKLIFKSTPLNSVIADVEKTYQIDIETNGLKTDSMLLSATFDEAPLQDVLTAISLTFNLKIDYKNEKSIIFQQQDN
jgi:transmembrane sensor